MQAMEAVGDLVITMHYVHLLVAIKLQKNTEKYLKYLLDWCIIM